MSVKVVTSLGVLMRYASELGKAKISGDADKIAEAQKKHDEYKKLCLEADEMATGFTHGNLY
jgi:hypothetical protein